MKKNLVAKSSITINVPVAKAWDALINPSIIRQYMFGTEVISDWKENSPILWKGIWKDKPYEDKGIIIKLSPEHILKYTHFSPLSGALDIPENYHTLTYELTHENGQTRILLSQDNNSNEEELAHSKQMWDSMLNELKKLLES